MLVFTPDLSKIAYDFGNVFAFSRHYNTPYTSVRKYLLRGDTPRRMRAQTLQNFKKMEKDGYVRIDYKD
ncbi:hypothetical protein [Helicobacter felis]|uniref:hypothetical protein n=1 Tax=Helicobacter felis TaxID=214 RepID=UPI000CF0BC4F|nr:hypothetical protein [Helicobacter felis]